jgi:hypothetical protein
VTTDACVGVGHDFIICFASSVLGTLLHQKELNVKHGKIPSNLSRNIGLEHSLSKWMIYQYEIVFNPYYEYIIRRVI